MSIAETVAGMQLPGDKSSGASNALEMRGARNAGARANVTKNGLAGEVRETPRVSDDLGDGYGRLRDILAYVGGAAGWIDISDVDDRGVDEAFPDGGDDLLGDVTPLQADDVEVFHAGFGAELLEGGISEVGRSATKRSGERLPGPHNLGPRNVRLRRQGEHGRAC